MTGGDEREGLSTGFGDGGAMTMDLEDGVAGLTAPPDERSEGDGDSRARLTVNGVAAREHVA
jgi:hypothetical protein